MFKTYDTVNGIPPRIYRNPQQIRRDISEIRQKIDETNAMLNIRSMLVEILAGERQDSPERLIPELEEAIGEARCALDKMRELKDELFALEEELGDVKCVLGI